MQLRVILITKLHKTIKPVKNIFVIDLEIFFDIIFLIKYFCILTISKKLTAP